MNCQWCHEAVEAGGQHPDFKEPMHIACAFRAVAGSVAHIEHRCSCYVPRSQENDPPAMTKRQAAEAALRAFQAQTHRWRWAMATCNGDPREADTNEEINR